MSHQDRKSKECIVVNHKSLKQAIDVLLPASVFRGIKMAGVPDGAHECWLW